MVRLFKDQCGYSLTEVMVAIMLLGLAIIPMVSMFDAGLRAAVLGSNYDQGRALANEKLEEIIALPYKDESAELDSVVEIYKPPDSPKTGTEGIFTYSIVTKYVDSNFANPADSPATPQMRIEIEVTWDNNSKSYTNVGYVADE